MGAEPPSDRTIYCILPDVLAAEHHDRLCDHFRDDPGVRVVVEDRARDCRSLRASLVPIPIPPDLPAEVQPFAALIRFVEPVESA